MFTIQCQRHDRFCSPGIHSGEGKTRMLLSAIGTTDIIWRLDASHSAVDKSAIPTALYIDGVIIPRVKTLGYGIGHA